jgi:phospholipase/carboxylesterase
MAYSQHETPEALTLAPDGEPRGAVIWLHGLGADGFDFAPIVPELRLPDSLPLRFIFPHAPMRRVTINQGFVMRAWYDILGFGPGSPEDEAGIRDSARIVTQFIERETARGLAENRILLAGFSQGGAIALHTALRHPRPLAGVMALSTYLPLVSRLAAEAAEANRGTPIFMAHGLHDGIVPVALGEASRAALEAHGNPVIWRTYPMEHQVCMDEIRDISQWLVQRFGDGATQ